MTRKMWLYLVVGVLCVVSLLAGSCAKPTPAPAPASTPAPPPAKVWNLKVQGFTPESEDPQYMVGKHISDLIKERTDGRVNITYYPGEGLVPTREQFSAGSQGLIDGIFFVDAYLAGSHPALGWSWVPWLLEWDRSWWDVADAVEDIQNELLRASNYEPLFWVNIGSCVTYNASGEHITKWEDLKGKRVRHAGGISEVLNNEAGAAGVVMPVGEVYTALKTGVIDLIMVGLPGTESWKLYEVAPNITNVGTAIGIPEYFFLFNLDVWESFPKDIQDTIRGLKPEVKKFTIEYTPVAYNSFITRWEQAGAKVIELDSEEQKRWVSLYKKDAIKYYLDKSGKAGQRILAIVEKATK